MLNVRGLGLLAVPVSISLAGMLVTACSERNPTAPDGMNAPSLAPSKTPLYDDPRGDGSCKGNDLVLRPINEFYEEGYDANNNDVICLRTTGPGPKK